MFFLGHRKSRTPKRSSEELLLFMSLRNPSCLFSRLSVRLLVRSFVPTLAGTFSTTPFDACTPFVVLSLSSSLLLLWYTGNCCFYTWSSSCFVLFFPSVFVSSIVSVFIPVSISVAVSVRVPIPVFLTISVAVPFPVLSFLFLFILLFVLLLFQPLSPRTFCLPGTTLLKAFGVAGPWFY